MIYKVHLLAFGEGNIRPVSVDSPSDNLDILLDQIFHFGQNDFQPVKGCYSVSVGDVIEVDNNYHLVLSIGFLQISSEEFNKWAACKRSPSIDEDSFREVISKIN